MMLFEVTSFIKGVFRWFKICMYPDAEKIQSEKTYESFPYLNELEGRLELDFGERYHLAFAWHFGFYNNIWITLWDWNQKAGDYLIGKIKV